jgi:cytochrome c
MKATWVLVALLGVLVSAPVRADPKADLKFVEAKQCFGCHDMVKEGAAPPFNKIAAFWKGKPEAERQIVSTVRRGSEGTGGPHWNKATMPDQAERPLVSEAEAKRIAKWILAR